MGVKLIGIGPLVLALNKKTDLSAVRKVVKQNGSEMQRKEKRYVPVDTGTLKRSIDLEIMDAGLTAAVDATAHYAPYVEYGTRFMTAIPFAYPSFVEQSKQFRKDLEELMK